MKARMQKFIGQLGNKVGNTYDLQAVTSSGKERYSTVCRRYLIYSNFFSGRHVWGYCGG
jgi:hypothetical protein